MGLPRFVPNWVLWPVSGVLLFLPFLFMEFWPLLPVGIALWLYALTKSQTWKEVIIGSFIVGLGKYAGGIFWFWETFPVENIEVIPVWQQMLFIGYFWIFSAIAMALGLTLVGVIFYWVRKFRPLWLVFFPVIFVIGEVVSSVFFSIYTTGPGSVINASFSFGYVGFPLSHLAILFPLVAVLGVYGLSLLVAIIGLLLFSIFAPELATQRHYYKLSLGLACIVVAAYVLTPSRQIEPLDTTVIAIETKFSKEALDTSAGYDLKMQSVLNAVQTAILIPSDIVLLPEDSRFTDTFKDSSATLDYLMQSSPKTGLVVDSFRAKKSDTEVVLRAAYYDLENGETYEIDKQYLVPIGEFVVNFEAASLRLMGKHEVLKKIMDNQNYVPGPKKSYETFAADLPGTLFCLESTDPFGVSKIANSRSSQLVLHPVSHSWFHNPDIFWKNLDAMLRVQAIWNNKTIVSAGNMSPSKIYYPNGQISTGKLIYETKNWNLVEYNL